MQTRDEGYILLGLIDIGLPVNISENNEVLQRSFLLKIDINGNKEGKGLLVR